MVRSAIEKMRVGLFVIMLLGLLSTTANAVPLSDDREEWDQEVEATAGTLDKARNRFYAGGRDEQELKVQSVLPNPNRVPEGKEWEIINTAPETTEQPAE
jgi:hypothetical protein